MTRRTMMDNLDQVEKVIREKFKGRMWDVERDDDLFYITSYKPDYILRLLVEGQFTDENSDTRELVVICYQIDSEEYNISFPNGFDDIEIEDYGGLEPSVFEAWLDDIFEEWKEYERFCKTTLKHAEKIKGTLETYFGGEVPSNLRNSRRDRNILLTLLGSVIPDIDQ